MSPPLAQAVVPVSYSHPQDMSESTQPLSQLPSNTQINASKDIHPGPLVGGPWPLRLLPNA